MKKETLDAILAERDLNYKTDEEMAATPVKDPPAPPARSDFASDIDEIITTIRSPVEPREKPAPRPRRHTLEVPPPPAPAEIQAILEKEKSEGIGQLTVAEAKQLGDYRKANPPAPTLDDAKALIKKRFDGTDLSEPENDILRGLDGNELDEVVEYEEELSDERVNAALGD